MSSQPLRHDEVVAFIRENTSTVPWPQVQEALRERGCSADEIAQALEEVFPGRKGRKKAGGVWAGMVGAVVGIVIWLILAVLYRGGR